MNEFPGPQGFTGLVFDGGLSVRVAPTAGPPPELYMRFATQDLTAGSDDRNSLNAVSNAKRAIHLRVDRLLQVYGGLKKSGLSLKSSFPRKFDYLANCGILAPEIVKKLNQSRNVVEHEYRLPSRDEAADYVDIAGLFVRSTSPFMSHYPKLLFLKTADKKFEGAARTEVRITFPPEQGVLSIRVRECVVAAQVLQKAVKELWRAEEDKIRQLAINLPALRQWHKSVYESVMRQHGTETAFSVEVNDGAVFFTWVRFLMELHDGEQCGKEEYRMAVSAGAESSIITSC